MKIPGHFIHFEMPAQPTALSRLEQPLDRGRGQLGRRLHTPPGLLQLPLALLDAKRREMPILLPVGGPHRRAVIAAGYVGGLGAIAAQTLGRVQGGLVMRCACGLNGGSDRARRRLGFIVSDHASQLVDANLLQAFGHVVLVLAGHVHHVQAEKVTGQAGKGHVQVYG